MKNILKNLTLIAVAVLAATVVNHNLPRVSAQATTSSVMVFPAVALSSCAWPGEVTAPPPTGYIAYCHTTQGLAYAIAPSTTFTLLSGGSATLPQSVTPASGTCITGYSSSTGAFSTGPCLPAITKAQVLATGLAASTTSTTTIQ